MKKRTLGRGGLEVSSLGYGAMGLSHVDASVSGVAIHGHRYSEGSQKMIDR